MEIWTRRIISRASEWRALLCLYDEARHDRGWRRRGVRGWRFYAEVGALLQAHVSDRLPPLVHKGLAERIDVRYPGRTKSEWIYRISPAGVDHVASSRGEDAPVLPSASDDDPDEGTLYLPSRMWRVAEALRQQARLEVGTRRWGVHGWMRPSEIKRASDVVLSNELTILQELRMAERRSTRVVVGRRTTPLWRITARGAAMALVDAVPVGSDPPLFVQVELRDSGPTAADAEAAWDPLLRLDSAEDRGAGPSSGPDVVKVVEVDSGPTREGEEG